METTHEHIAEKDRTGYHVHSVSPKLLLGVFGALLVLTGATVGVTYVDLGPANIWIALGIAVAKAGLVALFFMHLRWDSPFNSVVFVTALAFIALFLGIAVLDTTQYQPHMQPPANVIEQP